MFPSHYQVTTESLLGTLPFNQGSIYMCIDSKRIYLDPIGGTERISFTGDPIILSTESERESLITPVSNKIYFITGTSSQYIYNNGNWYKISGLPSISENDNGKFLGAVNGEPKWIAIANFEEEAF